MQNWATTKREIVRALVQRIEIGPTKVAVVLRLPTDEGPRLGAGYSDIIPRVKSPLNGMPQRLTTAIA